MSVPPPLLMLAGEFKQRLCDDFDMAVSPLVFDLSLRVEAASLQVRCMGIQVAAGFSWLQLAYASHELCSQIHRRKPARPWPLSRGSRRSLDPFSTYATSFCSAGRPLGGPFQSTCATSFCGAGRPLGVPSEMSLLGASMEESTS